MEYEYKTLTDKIKEKRKESGLTQDELAEKLGITFQAVSKWENGICAPDIALLPALADIFECTIDELFSRETEVTEEQSAVSSALPWEDDGIYRGVIYKGRNLISSEETIREFTLRVEGDVKEVRSQCGITVEGDVGGNVTSEGGVSVEGDVGGKCNSEKGSISVRGDVGGNCECMGNIAVGGDVGGHCECSAGITAGCDIGGNCECGGDCAVGRDIGGNCRVGGNLIIGGNILGTLKEQEPV